MPREPKGIFSTVLTLLKARHPDKRIGTEPERAGHVHISTVYANDLKCWETAVVYRGQGHPVERYDSQQEAVKGHQRWIFEAPYMDEIVQLGYGELIPPTTVPIPRH